MKNFRHTFLSLISLLVVFGFGCYFICSQTVNAQNKLTYPEIITALNNKFPNRAFKSKAEMIKWLIVQIKQRKIDKPLTQDREDDLRQAGATDELIEVIRKISPSLVLASTPVPNFSTPTPTPTPNFSTSNQIPTSASNSDWLKEAQRGNDFLDKHDYDGAIAAYNKAFELNPIAAPVLISRGYSYHYKGDERMAVADYVSAVKGNPNLSDEPYIKCLTLTTFGNYADVVIENCSKSITANPDVAAYYFKRGLAYQNKQDYAKAIADYNKAIELEPKFLLAYSNLGFSHFKMQNYDQAIDKYGKVIEFEPKNPFGYYYRGIAYMNKKDFDQATIDFNRAIELEPKFYGAYFNRGYIYMNKKDCGKAIADYDKVIEINPRDYGAYINRGNCYSDRQDYARALKDYNKAIELSPNNYAAYRNRANVYEKLGQPNLAHIDRNKADALEKANKP